MNVTPATPIAETSSVDLGRLGIVRIAAERFEVGGYRYDRLSDAMAEARRRDDPRESR